MKIWPISAAILSVALMILTLSSNSLLAKGPILAIEDLSRRSTDYLDVDRRMMEHLRNHEYSSPNLHMHSDGILHRHEIGGSSKRITGHNKVFAPAPPVLNSPNGSVRFVVVGDTQGNSESGFHSEFVPQLIDDIESRNPDFVVFPGDLVGTGSVTTFIQWSQLTSQFGNNRFMVPGNHDLPGRPATNQNWQTVFHWLPDSQVVPDITTPDPNDTIKGIDQMDYFVDPAPGIRLISVTTDRDLLQGETATHSGGYEILGGEPKALNWFKSVMALDSTKSKDYVFVMTHHPITNHMSETGNQQIELTQGTPTEWWKSIAGRSETPGLAQAIGIFAGHAHAYYPNRPDPNSTTSELIVGTGGGASEGVPHRHAHGFMEVIVAEGSVTTILYGDSNEAVGGWSFTEVLDVHTVLMDGVVPTGELALYEFENGSVECDTSNSPISKHHKLSFRPGVITTLDPFEGWVLTLNGSADGIAHAKNIGDQNLQVLRDLQLELTVKAVGELGTLPTDNVLIAYGDADDSRTTSGGHDTITIQQEIANYPYILSYTQQGNLCLAWEYNDDPDVDSSNQIVKCISTHAVPNPNEWHDILVERDAENKLVRFIVDDAQLGELVPFEFLPTGGGAGSLYIGALPNLQSGNDGGIATFTGRIDNVRIASGLSRGDTNGDGRVDLLDVASFVFALSSGEFSPAADVNWDGVVNLLDIAPFVELLL